MNNLTGRLLIIPARGNSKRIKNKNIKKFNGNPIIFYTLETAIKSKLFKKIHVSTDSKKIAKIIKYKKLSMDFYRPRHLSGDKVGIIDVIKHVVEQFKKVNKIFDEIWCMTPCAPLVNLKDLLKASKILKKNKKKIIISISEYPAPIEWAFSKKKKNNLIPFKKGAYKTRSQDLKKKYYDTGDFICMKYDLLKRINSKTNLDMLYHGIKLPKYRSIDIDNLDDWKMAEKYFKILKM